MVEQRRIVAKLDALAAKIGEAHQSQAEAQLLAKKMLASAFSTITRDSARIPMRQVAPLVRRKINVEVGGKYSELGVRSFGKGTFHKPFLNGIEVSKKLFQIEPGDLIFNNVFAWEGAVAVVHEKDRGRVGSHRFISCVPDPNFATSHFLCYHFLTDEGLEKLGLASPGGAGRNRTLGLKALENIEVPVPPVESQKWFDSLQAKAAALKNLEAQTATELDAIMPASLELAFKGAL